MFNQHLSFRSLGRWYPSTQISQFDGIAWVKGKKAYFYPRALTAKMVSFLWPIFSARSLSNAPIGAWLVSWLSSLCVKIQSPYLETILLSLLGSLSWSSSTVRVSFLWHYPDDTEEGAPAGFEAAGWASRAFISLSSPLIFTNHVCGFYPTL